MVTNKDGCKNSKLVKAPIRFVVIIVAVAVDSSVVAVVAIAVDGKAVAVACDSLSLLFGPLPVPLPRAGRLPADEPPPPVGGDLIAGVKGRVEEPPVHETSIMDRMFDTGTWSHTRVCVTGGGWLVSGRPSRTRQRHRQGPKTTGLEILVVQQSTCTSGASFSPLECLVRNSLECCCGLSSGRNCSAAIQSELITVLSQVVLAFGWKIFVARP